MSSTNRARNGGEVQTELDTFVDDSSSKSSPQQRKGYYAVSKDQTESCCWSKGCVMKVVTGMVCTLLALALGFLIGFYTQSAIATSTVTMTTETRETMHQQALDSVSQSKIEEYERLHTSQQCAIGSTHCTSNLTQTIVDQLSAMGFKVSTSMYNVLVSYPNMTRTSTLRSMDTQGNILQTVELYGGGDMGSEYQLAPRAGQSNSGSNDHDVLSGSSGDSVLVTNGGSQAMPIYTPYTASGMAKGDLVYVNYGRETDFVALTDIEVNVTGKIGLVRQGLGSAYDQAKIAASQGIIGLLLYPDPSDMTSDMPMTFVMTPDLSGMIGDPLTPGCPSVDGIYRSSMNSVDLPSIPIQPVSMATAAMLLSNLTGVLAEGSWIGGLNVTYHIGYTGQTRQSWFVELDVHNDIVQKPIYDVVATIEGSENPDQYVLLGGHYSSTMTALVSSGSASGVLEAARVIGGLMDGGWMPRRTIVIGLWEGSEFGHSGSTEWAEENRLVLQDRAVAYIDLGGGGDDTILNTQASPMLHGVVMQAAEQF